jgi:hypothetical protein
MSSSTALTAPAPDASAGLNREASILDRIAEETQRTATRYMPTLTVKQFSEREQMLRELKALLVEDIDYGKIPGVGDKPVLFKSGAEKLCAFFGYAPHYSSECIEDWDGGKYGEALFYYKYTCTLSKDGKPVGEGQGSCNSWESKYRYRNASRVCPACGKDSIIKGKEQYGGGWICFAKKGGCGAKYIDGDPAIEAQQVGRIANPDFADIINTVQKMGQKRAMVAAVLSATGASQYFTQDIEDSPQTFGAAPEHAKREAAQAPKDRKVPEELTVVVDKLRKGDASAVKSACAFLEKECAALGISAAYTNRNAGIRASFPKGTAIPPDVMENFLLDVWGEIEAMRMRRVAESAPKTEERKVGGHVADDEDVPF